MCIQVILFTLLHGLAHLIIGHLRPEGIIVKKSSSTHMGMLRKRAANDLVGSWILSQPLPFIRERIN